MDTTIDRKKAMAVQEKNQQSNIESMYVLLDRHATAACHNGSGFLTLNFKTTHDEHRKVLHNMMYDRHPDIHVNLLFYLDQVPLLKKHFNTMYWRQYQKDDQTHVTMMWDLKIENLIIDGWKFEKSFYVSNVLGYPWEIDCHQFDRKFCLRSYDGKTLKIDMDGNSGCKHLCDNWDITYHFEITIDGSPEIRQLNFPQSAQDPKAVVLLPLWTRPSETTYGKNSQIFIKFWTTNNRK